jgi:hypothetical protein
MHDPAENLMGAADERADEVGNAPKKAPAVRPEVVRGSVESDSMSRNTVRLTDELIATGATASATAAHLHTPSDLASRQRILDEFAVRLRACGVVGEDRNAKLIFLALCSRLLDHPVSLAIKGLSSSGKSFTTETVLRFFPKSAYIEMTAMSERALVYSKEDYAHRMIVLFEAVALREQREKTESNLTAYFVRSLLSEGRIRYPVTVKDKEGNFTVRTIEKNGPTGLVLTTTATSLHGENETRLISLPTNDSREQTRAVLLQIAKVTNVEQDLSGWHDLQRWLEGAEHEVVIPYAEYVAERIPPVAVRLRRDFGAILQLIRTHAMLHRLTRARDDRGRVVAEEDDYQVVRELVADLISEGVEATVPTTVRETVRCVGELADEEGATVNQVAARLQLERSTAQRRLQSGRERGYLVNLEDRRGRPARYVLGEPMPDEVVLLPHTCTPSADEPTGQEGVCSDAAPAEGNESPPSAHHVGPHPAGDGTHGTPPASHVGPEADEQVPAGTEANEAIPKLPHAVSPVHASGTRQGRGAGADEAREAVERVVRLFNAEELPASAIDAIREQQSLGRPDQVIASYLNSGGYGPPPGYARWTADAVRAERRR